MTLVCVAGMHRSGTSLVSMIFSKSGVYMGPQKMLEKANKNNEKGFWENTDFVKLNDKIMEAYGGTWATPPTFPPDWRFGASSNFLDEAINLFYEHIEGHKFSGWKDPRNSITLPFWLHYRYDIELIVCLRNPLEVVHSYPHTSQERTLWRWYEYNSRILSTTHHLERLVVHYSSLFHEPAQELERIHNYIGIESELDVMECVDPELRHSKFDYVDLVEAIGNADVNDYRNHPVTVLYAKMLEEAGPNHNG